MHARTHVRVSAQFMISIRLIRPDKLDIDENYLLILS